MYTALEVAKYTINKCIKLGRPISNLQLQKILYYIQGEYMKENNGQPLFDDRIEAWQYGPVVPDVYYEYNWYSASEITDYQSEVNLNLKVSKIIDPIIISKSQLSAWLLVEKTHSESPWITAFNKYNGSVITREQMISFFCN